MKKIIIQSSTDVSHSLLTSELSSNDITYSERTLTDTSFPSLNSAFGELTLSYEFKHDIEIIFKKLGSKDYTVTIAEQNNLMQKYVRTGLITYSIIMTLMFLKYLHIDYLNTIDKNFNIKWNHSNVILTYSDKKTGELVSRYKDSNYDNNFELSETYINGIGPTVVFQDRNENGFNEDISYFDFSGNYIGMSQDIDEDGSLDIYQMILENGDTLNFKDSNRNGVMELEK
jgi:hypothetical protein